MLGYLCGAVEAFLEHRADTPEWGHDLPAGSQLTGARDAVALTLHLHIVQNSLGEREREMRGFEKINKKSNVLLVVNKLNEKQMSQAAAATNRPSDRPRCCGYS